MRGSSQSQESHNKRLLLQTLGEEPLPIIFSNICILLRHMFEDQNYKNLFHFDKFKMKKKKYVVLLLLFFIEKEKIRSFTLAFLYWKRKKYVVLLLPFFILLVSISYYIDTHRENTPSNKTAVWICKIKVWICIFGQLVY